MFALYRLSHFVMSPNFRSSCTSPSVLYLFDPLKIGFCWIICLPLQIGYSLTGCSIGYSSLLWSTSCFHYLFGVRISRRIVDVVNICMRVPNIQIEWQEVTVKSYSIGLRTSVTKLHEHIVRYQILSKSIIFCVNIN